MPPVKTALTSKSLSKRSDRQRALLRADLRKLRGRVRFNLDLDATRR